MTMKGWDWQTGIGRESAHRPRGILRRGEEMVGVEVR